MTARVEVVGIGEAMALFVPEGGPLGEATTLSMRLAGAESNVLIAMARLGHDCAYLSAVGDDPLGDFVVRTLAREGVATRDVRRDPTHRTGVLFKDPTPAARRQVHYYRDGSAASVLDHRALDGLDRLRPRVLIVSGLTLGLGDRDGLAGVAEAAIERARSLGTTVVFDANVRPGLWDGRAAATQFDALRRHLDVVLAGVDEMATLRDGEDPLDAARTLIADGCRAVVVKRGAHGSTVVEPDRTTQVPAVPVPEIIDAVGAGDAYAAGIVAGILRGWPLRRGAELGAALAARVLQGQGDWESLPSGDDARTLVEMIERGDA